jgi:pimeloyl-ACP methyl ester carboxylesterase
VLGEKDDVGLRDDERRLLAGCPQVRVVEIPGAGHMALIQVPGQVAQIVREAVASATPASGA